MIWDGIDPVTVITSKPATTFSPVGLAEQIARLDLIKRIESKRNGLTPDEARILWKQFGVTLKDMAHFSPECLRSLLAYARNPQ